MNLVVVSNRVARAKANEPMTGGLAAALLPIVQKNGATWLGSSGRLSEGQKSPLVEIESLGHGMLAMLDFPAAHYGGYYQGFANSALWPALHSRSDLIRASGEDYRSYREVNSFVAEALLRFRKSDAVYWIQDYHFLALGAEMRRLGVTEPIGFFLHTPWPVRSIAASIPNHRQLIESMLSYDLVGFQTEEDCENFADYIRHELGLEVEDGLVTSRYGLSRLAVFPIGIDVEGFASMASKAITHPDVSRLRLSLRGERLAIGVDRIDYSKGLVNRICSFDRLLEMYPSLQRTISLLQIATPSRGTIKAYERLQGELANLVTEVNGRHGEVDWTPIRYLTKGYGQQVLAGFYRSAHIGMVTPLQDGMNLVAKEYVAAQNPDDPGVLILSRYAGAAKELDAALIVNPFDIDAMAQAMHSALTMSILERRERWAAMMAKLKAHTIHQWFAEFVSVLEETPVRREFSSLEPALVPVAGAATRANARVH
jgi:trehalose 6-phosphate synthase